MKAITAYAVLAGSALLGMVVTILLILLLARIIYKTKRRLEHGGVALR